MRSNPGRKAPARRRETKGGRLRYQFLIETYETEIEKVLSVWAMLKPEEAVKRKTLLIAAAACGNFGVWTDLKALRTALCLAALGKHAPHGNGMGEDDPTQVLLPHVPEILDNPLKWHDLWADEETRIIPGHGPLASKKDLRVAVDMLKDALNRVRTLVEADRTEEEILAANPLADYHDDWNWGFITTERMTKTLVRALSGD